MYYLPVLRLAEMLEVPCVYFSRTHEWCMSGKYRSTNEGAISLILEQALQAGKTPQELVRAESAMTRLQERMKRSHASSLKLS